MNLFPQPFKQTVQTSCAASALGLAMLGIDCVVASAWAVTPQPSHPLSTLNHHQQSAQKQVAPKPLLQRSNQQKLSQQKLSQLAPNQVPITAPTQSAPNTPVTAPANVPPADPTAAPTIAPTPISTPTPTTPETLPPSSTGNPSPSNPSPGNSPSPVDTPAPAADTPITPATDAGNSSQGDSPLGRIEIAPNVSTMGIGGSISTPLSSAVKLRAGFNGFSFRQNINTDNVKFDTKYKLSNISVMTDYFPGGANSGFHLTVGAVVQNNKATGNAIPNSNQTITFRDENGLTRTVNVQDLGGSLKAEAKFKNDVAPYVGIGYSAPIAKKNQLSFFTNLGVMFVGKTEVSITPADATALDRVPGLRNDLDREVNQFKDQVEAIPSIYPVLTLGLSYQF